MRMHLVLLLLVASSYFSYSQPLKTEKPTVLFSLNKTPTYADEFIYLYKKNHQNKSEDFSEAKINEYLDLFINFKLKVTEARALGMDTTKKFIKELKTYREDLKKPYRAEPDVLDKLTKETYEHLKQEVRASHILISVNADALPADTLNAYTKIADIKKRILAGEYFEKMARELSEDPSGKYNGGDLGYFTAMQMVYPFEQAAYNTPTGEVSKIVRTRFGYHLIKVIDKKSARGEVEVSHILLRSSSPTDTKTKNTVFEIFDQLKGGRPWDELCKEYSQDTNTKDAGGKLRAFGIGALPTVPEFENMAFALEKPGEISDPFQSSMGWHIIKLEKKIPLPLYAELEPSLKRKVARDERLQISQQNLNAKRRRDFAFLENSENKKVIFELADSSLTKGKWKIQLSKEVGSNTLFTLEGKAYSIEAFIKFAIGDQTASTLTPSSYIDQLYNYFVDETINSLEEEKLIAEKPDFKNLLTEYREGILFFEIMEKKIWNKASEDTVGQRAYYNSHLHKFKADERVEARIFSTPDKNVLEEFKRKIDKGDTLKETDIKKFKSVIPFRNYEKGDNKVIDKVTWAAGVHEVELDNTYYLVEVSKLVAPGTKRFDEARASIVSDYQTELEKSWIADLKKKYPIQINKKGKKIVLDSLIKK